METEEGPSNWPDTVLNRDPYDKATPNEDYRYFRLSVPFFKGSTGTARQSRKYNRFMNHPCWFTTDHVIHETVSVSAKSA